MKIKYIYKIDLFNRFKIADILNNNRFGDFTMKWYYFLFNQAENSELCYVEPKQYNGLVDIP